MKILKKLIFIILKYAPLIMIWSNILYIYFGYINIFFELIFDRELIVIAIFYNGYSNYLLPIYFSFILIFFIFCCILKIIFTNPGNIPKVWHEKNFEILINEYINLEFDDKGIFKNLVNINIIKNVNIKNLEFKEFLFHKNQRYCKVCNLLKPERSHHCSQCNKCVLKMDHHCIWLTNCIGFNNYKFFLLLILYLEILFILMGYTFIKGFIYAYYSNDINNLKYFFVSTTFISYLIIFSWISSLFGFHYFKLGNNNITTIEFCSKKYDYDIYNLGFYNNIVNIFGKNPLCWFFPINLNPRKNTNGIKFDRNNEEEMMILQKI